MYALDIMIDAPAQRHTVEKETNEFTMKESYPSWAHGKCKLTNERIASSYSALIWRKERMVLHGSHHLMQFIAVPKMQISKP